MASHPFSLMSGEEIRNAGLVVDAVESLYHAATYDVSVGDIIAVEETGASTPTEYKLPPGGTVRVVSRESLQMPLDVTAHALLKNELCRKGILAINIGVVDPGFGGPLSSILVNFGRGDFPVRKGESFLRLSFFRCPQSAKAKKFGCDRAEYVERVREEVLAFSAPTFLNIEETSKQAADRAFGKFKDSLVLWATLAAVAFTLITILVPLGASYVDRFVSQRERTEQKTQQSIKALSAQIEELRKEIAAKPAR